MKAFPIDFVRQIIEQTLEQEHYLFPKRYFGGKRQVNLFSFYEQLDKGSNIDRYVEMYQDLIDEQNRADLIMNGVILAPENPTITNIYSATIIPMTFTCAFKLILENRDDAINTIDHMIEMLKGRKQDVALFNDGSIFMVGTMGNNIIGAPQIKNRDFIGVSNSAITNVNTWLNSRLSSLISTYGLTSSLQVNDCVYVGIDLTRSTRLKAIRITQVSPTFEGEFVTDEDNEYGIFVPPDINYEKYKVSLSFDSLRCDQPITLNAKEYFTISFGGSATLVSNGVKLGNDMVKVSFEKKQIIADPTISITDTPHWLEPLEMPSSNNANTKVNNLLSNRFISNSHTNALAISLQYTFILDENNSLLEQWFDYGRYGTQADGTEVTYANGITPNMIYEIKELWITWGDVKAKTFNAKIVESIDVEETESDVLSITIPLQLQGDNN